MDRINDRLLQTLADFRSNGSVAPAPSINVEKRSIGGCEVAVVSVAPSVSPPVRYKGVTWVRVGPSRRRASAEDERLLTEKRRSLDQPFDARRCSSAARGDLDSEAIGAYLRAAIDAEVLRENGRSPDEQLASLRMLVAGGGGAATNLGVLVLGSSPADHLAGAYVQFLRVAGTELSGSIRNQEEVHGPVSLVLARLDDLFRANIDVRTSITSGDVELREPSYPLVALQQYARNAVIHRNYETSNAPTRVYWFDDRIEIHSPGGPYGQVTAANFGRAGVTDYRNPNLAAALKELGFVQRFGVGLATAEKALSDNENPAPEYEAQPTSVLVTVRGRI